jgi:biopolymer transport protein TolR
MAEINVTPFVDVMLVLLIVFMVSAPLLTAGVPLDLPQANSNPLSTQDEPITLSVDADGRIFLQTTEIELGDLVAKLTAIAANGYDERIFVRGDRNANYGAVMRVMSTLSQAGFTRIGLVTTPSEDG